MSRRVWVAVAVLALGGCTSTSDLLKKDPVFFGHTNKPAQAYAQCVADSWRRQGEQVKMTQTANGYDVVDEGTVGPVGVLRVLQYADGRVEVRMAARSSYGSQNLVQSANLCM